jgi:uncharacterized protein YqiB (DUF1249 family)
LQVVRHKSYKLDLSDLHSICEANYARLLRLFPDYETRNCRDFTLGEAKVSFEVIERCRYTTIFRLQQHSPAGPLLGPIRIEARVYHDARMLEVGRFQSQRVTHPRYEYPNEAMYQQDEKSQQNYFLADWLEHCLQNGRAYPTVIIDSPAV